MPSLEELEARFFAEGPKFCLQAAVALLGASLALSTLSAAFSSEGVWYQHFGFAGLMLVPVVLLVLLSFCLKQRHVGTIVIVLLICIFEIRYFLVVPSSAFEGMQVPVWYYLVGWVLFFGQIAVVFFALWFMQFLWRKGAFR